MVKKKSITATIHKIYFGETPQGTGPAGGNCGRQWMADIWLHQNKKVILKRTEYVLNKGGHNPTESEMKLACQGTIHKYIEDIPNVKAEKMMEASVKRKLKKINAMSKRIKVTQ